MHESKVIHDLITSATSAKAHFEVWWAQVGKVRSQYFEAISRHSLFFNASHDAHYVAFWVYLAHLYEKRSDSITIPAFLDELGVTGDSHEHLKKEFDGLRSRAIPILKARHKTVAHIDRSLSEKEVFAEIGVTWDQIRDFVYDSANFVSRLADLVDTSSIVCGDQWYYEATIELLRELQTGRGG